jgi:hypothetical protein
MNAWLIELAPGKGPPAYWGRIDSDEEGIAGWTCNVEEAIRFCRQEDAQAIIDDLGLTDTVAIEHGWPELNTPPRKEAGERPQAEGLPERAFRPSLTPPHSGKPQRWAADIARIADLESDLAASRRDYAEAVDALKSFAKQADHYDEIPGVLLVHDNVEVWQDGNYRCPISVGEIRRARALVAAADAKGGEG